MAEAAIVPVIDKENRGSAFQNHFESFLGKIPQYVFILKLGGIAAMAASAIFVDGDVFAALLTDMRMPLLPWNMRVINANTSSGPWNRFSFAGARKPKWV